MDSLRRAALALCAILTLGGCAPPKPYEATAKPAEPDYSQSAAWLAYPGTNGLERSTPPGLTAIDEAKAPADVFFIPPTTYLKSDVWNAAYDADAPLNKPVQLNQISAFNGCCRLFAPHYRQASLHSLSKSRPAQELAYADVARAFRYYIEHENHGRPFILASHSQGSMHAVRLLQDEILNTPLKSRLVAAYVIGAYAPDSFAGIGLPTCDSPRQTGCILSWNTSQKGRDGAMILVRDKTYWWRGAWKDSGQPLAICVNPLTWTRDGVAGPAANAGSLPFPKPPFPAAAGPFAPLPAHLTGAACNGNRLLDVDIPGSGPKGFHDLLNLLTGSYHALDYGIFYLSIRQNAADRVDAWLSANPPMK